MNIVVIGLGSMGKRRIRLMREIFPEFNIYGVDERSDRRKEVNNQFGIDTFDSIEHLTELIDCAFICTSPLSHANLVKECLNREWNIFTELNLVDTGYSENMKLAKEKGCTLFLSSTFFYREEIRYIQSRVTEELQWNYIYHVGQYLPDWHPWENYKDFFVGDKRTNGCREIMAIEFPWLIRTFGEVVDVHVIANKMSELNIGYDDNYLIQFTHGNGNKGVLVVDVVSPVAVRKLEVYAEGKYLSWNGTPDSIFEYNANEKELVHISLLEKPEHMDGYSAFVIENAYKNEIKEFFDVVSKKKKPLYGFEQDQAILQLIDSLGA